MIQNEDELLEAFDGIRYPPFEMAVLDPLGRVGIVYSDEDGLLGIQRLAYEGEPNDPVSITGADFPMMRLVAEQNEPTDDQVRAAAMAMYRITNQLSMSGARDLARAALESARLHPIRVSPTPDTPI